MQLFLTDTTVLQSLLQLGHRDYSVRPECFKRSSLRISTKARYTVYIASICNIQILLASNIAVAHFSVSRVRDTILTYVILRYVTYINKKNWPAEEKTSQRSYLIPRFYAIYRDFYVSSRANCAFSMPTFKYNKNILYAHITDIDIQVYLEVCRLHNTYLAGVSSLSADLTLGAK